MKLKCIKAVILMAATLIGLDGMAQDLIARQAPIDRQLKSVDSLALLKQIKAEQSLYPGFDLYPSWSNETAHAYANAVVPEEYTFDLTGFCMPTTHTRITDVFGYRPRRRRAHKGLDIKVYVGDTIRAAFDGKVRIVKNQGRRTGYGKYIIIRHDNGLETVYGHLSKQLVKENQLVKAGDPIALEATRAVPRVRICTSRLVFWALHSTRQRCSTSRSRTSWPIPIRSASRRKTRLPAAKACIIR